MGKNRYAVCRGQTGMKTAILSEIYITARKKVCQRNSLFLPFDVLFLGPLQIHYTAPRNLVCLLFPLLVQEKKLRQIHIALPCLSWKH